MKESCVTYLCSLHTLCDRMEGIRIAGNLLEAGIFAATLTGHHPWEEDKSNPYPDT